MTSKLLRVVAEANLKQALGVVWAYPAAADALDMLALFTEPERDAFYDTLLTGLGYRREGAGYEPSTRACLTCGTWTCSACGFRRYGRRLGTWQVCPKCGGHRGSFPGTRHRREAWEKHNPGKEWPES